jgi:hypothetical protein
MNVHVIKSGDRWAVKKPELSRASRLCPTKANAISWAEIYKRRIIVHNPDGTIERIIEP